MPQEGRAPSRTLWPQLFRHPEGQAVTCGNPTAAQVHVAFRQWRLAASAHFGSVISVFKISFKRQGESWARFVNVNPEVCRGQGQNEVTRAKVGTDLTLPRHDLKAVRIMSQVNIVASRNLP